MGETVSAEFFLIGSCSPVVAPKAQSQLCLTFIKFVLIFRQDLHYFLHLCFSYTTLFPLQFNTYAAKLSFKLKSFLSRTLLAYIFKSAQVEYYRTVVEMIFCSCQSFLINSRATQVQILRETTRRRLAIVISHTYFSCYFDCFHAEAATAAAFAAVQNLTKLLISLPASLGK